MNCLTERLGKAEPIHQISRMRVCSVKGCTFPTNGRSLCPAHRRRKRLGHNMAEPVVRKGSVDEFFATLSMADTDSCILWPFAGKTRGGYGTVKRNGKTVYAHRLVCAEQNGPPPTAKHVAAHSCGNGHLGCVNPKHLRWATVAENVEDSFIHGNRVHA